MRRFAFGVVALMSLGWVVVGWAAQPADGPTSEEIQSEWVVEGTDADAVYEPGVGEATDEDAVLKDGILEGGELMAVVQNEPPAGARLVKPGEVVAPADERPGERVVPGPEKFVPGGLEPGFYDGTKDTGKSIWRLQGLLDKGGKTFRFLGDRVFQARVETVEHKEPRWVWGSHTTEKVTHTPAWRKVKVGETVIRKRTGSQPSQRFVEHRVVRKLWKNPDDPTAAPVMASVLCPVYQRILAPVFQQYRVPVYAWEGVKVGTYERSTFLTWIKRYRTVKGTYTVWTYWGTLADWKTQNPAFAAAADRARAVTERVMNERRNLMAKVRFDAMDTFLRKDKPAEDPKEEFFLRQKKASLEPDAQSFIEDDVPEAELVSLPPPTGK